VRVGPRSAGAAGASRRRLHQHHVLARRALASWCIATASSLMARCNPGNQQSLARIMA